MRILIVEDESISRKVLHKLISRSFSCDTACNGKVALQAFEIAMRNNKPYDLIFLDIMMPEMDGHECLAAIRRIEKEKQVKPGEETKVVIVSALSDQKNICQAFFKGNAVCYLKKPVIREELMALLESASQ
jgi:two-component system chemotaxis response regulator CheY